MLSADLAEASEAVGPVGRRRARRAFRLAVRHYAMQLREDRRVAVPAFLLPGLGSTLAWFCPPLVIGAMLERFGDGERPTLGSLVPYLVAFTAVWLGGEVVWRAGIHFLNRTAATGAAKLQIRGMEALFAKDLAFFQDNFTGSLTKKVVGYGHSYAAAVGTLAFQVASSVLPIGFVAIVLWRYSPWIVFALVVMVILTAVAITPPILRRQKLVDAREAASNRVAGHVADTITNIDAVRLFSREAHEGPPTPATSSAGGRWPCGHRVRATGRHRRPDPGRGRRSQRQRLHRGAAPRATRPWSVNVASNFPAGNDSGSPSPEPSSEQRPS